MNELRPADEYSFFVPWLGFPHEDWALTRGSILLSVLILLWYFMASALEASIQIFAASEVFESLVPTFVDFFNYTLRWGWLVAIGLSLWGWECMRTKKYREVIG